MERQNVHNSRDGKVNFQFGGPENKCRGHEFAGVGGGGGVWGHPSPKNFIMISGNNLWWIVFFSFLYFICNFIYQNKIKCRPRKKWGKREKAPSSLNPPSLNSLNVF